MNTIIRDALVHLPSDASDFEKARALLSDPARWTTGAFARRADGLFCYEHDADAVCWCALGALVAVKPHSVINAHGRINNMEFATLLRHCIDGNPAQFNDTREHCDILEWFDAIIKEEKSKC